MGVNSGNNKIGQLYVGNQEIAEAYVGNQLVFQNVPPYQWPPYLTNKGYVDSQLTVFSTTKADIVPGVGIVLEAPTIGGGGRIDIRGANFGILASNRSYVRWTIDINGTTYSREMTLESSVKELSVDSVQGYVRIRYGVNSPTQYTGYQIALSDGNVARTISNFKLEIL